MLCQHQPQLLECGFLIWQVYGTDALREAGRGLKSNLGVSSSLSQHSVHNASPDSATLV